MNKVLLILSAVFITAGVLAQVPEKMSYQAVVRNGKNKLVANQPIGLRISIIQGAVNGAKVYQEVFKPNPVTNANGLVTAEIGSGTLTLGAFSSINWTNGPYFIKAETDTTGGTNYTITGTTRLLSVPYALHAKTAESLSGTITETDPAFAAWNKDYNELINKPDLSVFATKDLVYQNNGRRDYNDLLNKPDLSVYATKDMLNQNIGKPDYNDLLNKPDLSVYAIKDMVNQNIANRDYNEIINKPDLSVYATKDMVNQNMINPNYADIINKPDFSIYATKDMANQNITNLANPVNPKDAATKAYVDALQKGVEELETDKLLAGGFIDERDGNHYEVVKIGNQVWMAENLKYLPEKTVTYQPWSNTQPRYYVKDENLIKNDPRSTPYYNTYGVLYNWPAAMNGAPESNSNTNRVQGVCPAGWHLPNHAEWDQLIDDLGGDNVAGGKLKEIGTWHWYNPNTGATNESGFTAIPAGVFMQYNDGFEFSGLGLNTKWWIASMDNTNTGKYYHSLTYFNSNVNINYWGVVDEKNAKAHGYSIRCVKD